MHIHAGMHQEHSDTNNTAADDDADTPPSSSVPLSTSSRAEEATMPVDSTDNVHSAVQAPQDYNKPVASTRDEVASSITPDEPAKVASTREEANHGQFRWL